MSSHRRWPFGRHIWKPTAVQIGEFTTGYSTYILYQCGCGALKVEMIDGGWTPEQVGVSRPAPGVGSEPGR